MLINLLYLIKYLTRSIAPTFVLGTTNACVAGNRETWLDLSVLGFHPKPITSTPHILNAHCDALWLSAHSCQLWKHSSSDTKIWLLPLFSRDSTVAYWLMLTKGQRFALLPPRPDLMRPCRGEAQWEGPSLWTQLQDGRHAGTKPSVTSGWSPGRPSWCPCHWWLWSFRETADGYFCSQETSKVRAGHMFKQMCFMKTLLRIHRAVKQA